MPHLTLRPAAVALAIYALSSCSSYIHNSGRYKDRDFDGTDREQIRAELGQPVASTDSYDIFKVRRHLPDSGRAFGTSILAAFTLGASEIIAFPLAVTRWSAESVVRRYALYEFLPDGQSLSRFAFDTPDFSRNLEQLRSKADLLPALPPLL